MIGIPENGLDLFEELCSSLRETTHVGSSDGSEFYELPIRYVDGSPIELKVSQDGTITDDGKTLLRLLAENRLERLNEWDELRPYCRTYRIAREGAELQFTGEDTAELFSYLEGLRRLEIAAPKKRGRSDAFNDVIRRKVKEFLNEEVREDRLPADDRDAIVHPDVTVEVEDDPRYEAIQLSVSADFITRDQKELVNVLSYGGETTTRRKNHIKKRLGDFVLLRDQPDLQSLAVIPDDGDYGDEEIGLILGYTGQRPLRLDDDTGPERLGRHLMTQEGYFSSDSED